MSTETTSRDDRAPASVKELMAAFLARDMADGEEIFVGTNLPVIRAAALLAHLHHGPNMRVMVAHTRTNLFRTPVMEHFELLTDWRAGRWAEAYFNDNEIVVFQKSRRDSVFFVGALQIDPHGNSNLIGLAGEHGPGISHARPGRHRHDDQREPRAALLSLRQRALAARLRRALRLREHRGLGAGGADARRRLGLPGGGPRYCVTPLSILDFEEESKRLRLRSVHPGVTVDQVVAATGFPLIIPDRVPDTALPTADELDILRRRVDPQGLLRR